MTAPSRTPSSKSAWAGRPSAIAVRNSPHTAHTWPHQPLNPRPPAPAAHRLGRPRVLSVHQDTPISDGRLVARQADAKLVAALEVPGGRGERPGQPAPPCALPG